MKNKKSIFAIVGSASAYSANLSIVSTIANLANDTMTVKIFNELKFLPHFDPELSRQNPPKEIIEFRKNIEQADAVIICTPEYVYSIPSGLKNGIEWCIASSSFVDKPVGLITASTSGQKAHDDLQLIMKTVMAKFTHEACLLIQGVKAKFDNQQNLIDNETKMRIEKFIDSFIKML